LRKTLILIPLIFLSGCAIKRVASYKPYNSGDLTMEQLVDSVFKKNISEDGYFIEKAEILVTINGKNEKFLLTVKFQKPDKFLISVRNTAGIEGARIYITKDSVFVNDRINSRLVLGKRSILERKTGIPADLQKVAFGDLLFNAEQTGNQYERIDNQIIIVKIQNNYEWKITLDPALRKVRAYEIINISNGRKGTFMFDNFSKGNRSVPFLITFEDKERNMGARLKISRIQTPWNGEIEFIPGKGYKKEEFK
jgi:outer membrane lipoprotein-sorting protein